MIESNQHSIADDVAFLREMIRSSRPRSGSEEAHDAWDDAIDRAYATLDRLVEQLEAAERERDEAHANTNEGLQWLRDDIEVKAETIRRLEEQLEALQGILRGFLHDADNGDVPSNGLREKAREILNG